MKLSRKIKLWFLPEYEIVLPVYPTVIPDLIEHITYMELAMAIKDMLYSNDENIHRSHGIHIRDVIESAVKANQVKRFGSGLGLFRLSPDFYQAINQYKIVNKID